MRKIIEERMRVLGVRSLRQLALKGGIDYSSLNRIYNGKAKGAEFDTLRRLSSVLRVSLDVLLEETPTVGPEVTDTAMKVVIEGAARLDAADRHAVAQYIKFLAQKKKAS